MRNKIIAGNWKMNTTISEGEELVEAILRSLIGIDLTGKKVIFGTPFLSLSAIARKINDISHVYVSAQNVSSFDSGAYTGEISAKMLAAAKVNMVIIGHSERREYFGETNEILYQKVLRTLENNLVPIFCCGEVLEDRKNNRFTSIIEKQIQEGLFGLSDRDFSKVIIAYEPVWAIGTGETASPAQAQEVHAFIRQLIAVHYSNEIAQNCSILYGGSMKPGNAKELLSMPDIDGGLIGGASLHVEDFVEIIKAI